MYCDLRLLKFTLVSLWIKKMVRGQKKSRDTNQEATINYKSSKWDGVVNNYVAIKNNEYF